MSSEPIMANAGQYKTLFSNKPQSSSQQIPTPHDIDESEEVLKDGIGRLIIRKGDFVIKYGVDVSAIEAENAMYVAQSTTVPVPKVFAIYQTQEEESRTFIVMEHVAGSSLITLWSGLDDATKVATAKTLRTYFDQLRQLKHRGYFGNINGGPPLDGLYVAATASHEISGSFSTEDEFIDSIIRVYRLEGGDRSTHRAQYYQRCLPKVLRGHGAPVFSHGDLQRKNIMLQPDGKPVLIDWEAAGWYPAYWEYASAIFAAGGWRDNCIITCLSSWMIPKRGYMVV
jgi:tRNA A-37 threonylcarbamoyl transferase component Bud32